jgi:ATP-dependent Lhr-like helicase
MLNGFHPLVDEWFTQKFSTPSEPQLQGWPAIQAGRDVLIAAPTGSGKTLAAFLCCLDKLIRQGLEGGLNDRIEVIYVSPLKALSNDIQKNLEQPLSELRALAEKKGMAWPEIRVQVRTGDTPQKERQALLRRPPHLLITTPESLYLLLTADKSRKVLGTTRTVIVDEIHALARDKRGAHLALSLERLENLCEKRPVRIGLSATQKPLEEVGRFLVGAGRLRSDGMPECTLIDGGSRRALDLGVVVPDEPLSSVSSSEQWAEMVQRLGQLVRQHRSSIIFVNTRRLVERLSYELEELLGPDVVAAHHGSMSRESRLVSEDRLKRGAVRAVVATASLELGIDVGAVDLVCQVGSPRTLAAALQRVGRSGHWRGATPKGRFFPTTRDELVEAAALIRGVERGALEQTEVLEWPLDILAQQIVAEASCEELDEEQLFATVKRAWPYAQLPRKDFDAVLLMLSEGVSGRRGRAGAYLHRDGVNNRIKGRRGARIAALTSGGAIPDNAVFSVVAEPDGHPVGSLAEEFVVGAGEGDIFLLGNTSWRVRKIDIGVVRVEDAQGAPPNVPFWEGEAPGRSVELSAEVGELQSLLAPLLDRPDEAIELLRRECRLEENAAVQIVAYLGASRHVLGALPSQKTLIAERFFDEGGGMQLVVHAPFGTRLNRAFGLALRKCFCRSFNFELQAAATDNGILLSLGPQHSFPLESVFEFLSPANLEEALVQAALRAPLFGARWRWNATRALALLRMQGGKKVAPQVQRMRSDDLLAAVFPMAAACQEHVSGTLEVPDHPLIKETVRDCLTEAMDFHGLLSLVERIRAGELTLVARDTTEPSPLSHEIINANPHAYLDEVPAAERRTRAVYTRRSLSPSAGDVRALGALDPAAIAEVREQVWPDPRDLDELHDALLTLCFLPESRVEAAWKPWLETLLIRGRVARTENGHGVAGWVAAERAALALAGLAPLKLTTTVPSRLLEGEGANPLAASPDQARKRIVRGWLEHSGPITAEALATLLGVRTSEVDEALLFLESEGLVLRGRFSPGVETTEWCERNLLARIHRLTLGRLRKEIEPCTAADYLRFLFRWQHVQPGNQLHGARGLDEVLGQLQGFQLAAGAWEREVLPSRLRGYQPEWLDELCLQGEIVWGRFLPAEGRPEASARKRIGPTRAVPIGLARRSDLQWLLDKPGVELAQLTEDAQRLLGLFRQRGASFWSELVAASKGVEPEALESALWELVAAGEITCDGFSGLRALIGGEREALPGRAHPLHRGGRWSLLRPRPEDLAESNGAADEVARVQSTSTMEWAQQYLRRYGVVFRDVLAREGCAPPWRDLVGVYRRLEARGEVRGGRFVAGFAGEQFAMPGAVETLRAIRRVPREGKEIVTLSGADPLNLAGVLTPGPRVPATLQHSVTFVDGVPRIDDKSNVIALESEVAQTGT